MSELQKNMLGLWREVLENQDIRLNDNIMEVGGTSLLIYKICMLASERFGIKVAPIDVMMYSSVDALTEYLEGGDAAKPAAGQALQKARPVRRRRQHGTGNHPI